MECAKFKNNSLVELKRIPEINPKDLAFFAEESLRESKRCLLFFGKKENEDIRIYLVMSDDTNSLLTAVTALFKKDDKSYESLTQIHPSFSPFERELYEEFGIVPKNHPFLKGFRYPHEGKNDFHDYPFYNISGDDVHTVAVGPVHAGIIEPGHFRFLCEGEKILHLEIQLGYQHRGVEKLFVKQNPKDKIQLAESVAGDSVIANAYAHAQLVENFLGIEVSADELLDRAIALEMERIAVHVGDIGAIANDIAYMIANAVSGANRTYVINTMLAICGSRFGRGMLRVGGNNFKITDEKRDLIRKNLNLVRTNMEQLCEEMFDSPSVLSRLENTGKVTEKQARDCGFVGMAAKSSGVKLDSRSDHPFGAYRKYPIYPLTMQTGDVFARTYLRYLEMQQSMNYINELLPLLKEERRAEKNMTEKLPEGFLSVSIVEGWRGEVVHALITDKTFGDRYKVKDPSFNNWFALALAVRGNGISDFPLCNKSFNLSYCGNDL